MDSTGSSGNAYSGRRDHPATDRLAWPGYLAKGKVHVLAGQPGTGKTTIAMAFVATAINGGTWPDRVRSLRGNALIWSGEDDPTDTLVPRLLASGADMKRIYFVSGVTERNEERYFDPARDFPVLLAKAREIGDISLLVVDPLVSAVSGDTNKNAETRRALQPLVELASELQCVVLGISHLTKGSAGREPIERITGSLAFGALARVVLMVAKLKDKITGDGQATAAPKRILVRAKSNIGPDTGGFEYGLVNEELGGYPDVGASRVEWGETIEGTASELLAEAEAEEEADGGTESPRDFLLRLLQSGPKPAKMILDEADAYGYSNSRMQRAARSLSVKREKLGLDGGWQWELPISRRCHLTPEDAEDANQDYLAPSTPSVTPSASHSLGEVI